MPTFENTERFSDRLFNLPDTEPYTFNKRAVECKRHLEDIAVARAELNQAELYWYEEYDLAFIAEEEPEDE